MTRTVIVAVIATAVVACGAWIGYQRFVLSSQNDPEGAVKIKVQFEGAKEQANLVRNPDGTYSYLVMRYDGRVERMSPQEFADRLYQQEMSRHFLAVLFNISSPIGIAWVCIGLLGQVIFAGRMLVQWLASEKQRRSVVPPLFWWMSILGALMLVFYFLWRRDAVGVLGQATGLAIYIRNIYLIYRENKLVSTADLAASV